MRKLKFEDVKQYFEDRDCELYETEYVNNRTLMRYRCKCGNKKCKICFSHFKNGRRCIECGGKEKFTFDYVYNYFKERNCKLLATEYINNRTPMEYECICGNDEDKICFNNFKRGNRCMKCVIERISGENNCNYNPNLTDEEREKNRSRPGCKKWKKLILKRDKNTCQYCFQVERKLCAHHIEDYLNNEELKTVLSNGFLFCEKHHIDFHKIYGYNCNREQLNEFLKNIK